MALRHPFLVFAAFFLLSACGLLGNGMGGYALLGMEAPEPGPAAPPCYVTANPRQSAWADSVLAALPLERRIGQLFMVAAYSDKGPEHLAALEKQVTDNHVGGLIFFQGGPIRQARITNRLQDLATLPLMIGIDGEWGLQMRLKDSTLAYPRQMTLGAHPNEELVRRMGADIARQCRRMGIHVNFAPVVDVNSNPANPVIGMRSFGENKENVALKGLAYMEGLQRGGVLACAKHFPGHGDAAEDSHIGLPTIKRTKKQLEDVELYPFRRMFADSLGSVMVAHLNIPALDAAAGRPSTLSSAITTTLLRKQMGFEGLAFTDALNMKGAANAAPPGQLEVAALQAGNDVLLFPEDVPAAIASIKTAIASGKLKEDDLNAHVRRILLAKWWAGLATKPAPIAEANLYADLHEGNTRGLINECYRAAITVVRNERALLPFKNLDTMHFAAVAIGAEGKNAFQQTLKKYAAFEQTTLPASPTAAQLSTAEKLVSGSNTLVKQTLVVSLHKLTGKAGAGYGISPEVAAWLSRLSTKYKLVVVAMGNPYALKALAALPTVVCGYEDVPEAQAAAAQALFGAGAIGGRLPVSLAANLPDGTGKFLPDARRLGFGEPEQVGLDSRRLARIDTLAEYVCKSHIAPGCQIVVARYGKVIYQKNFGGLAYAAEDATQTPPGPVTDSTLYDIASITKTAGTLQAIMFLQERGDLDVSRPLQDYLPETANTNKGALVLADILTHQAGLLPTLPHWEKTLVRGRVGQIKGHHKPEIAPPTLATDSSNASAIGFGGIADSIGPDSAHTATAPQQPMQGDEPVVLPGTRLSDAFYCDTPDDNWFTVEVAPGVYTMKTIEDTLWRWTLRSALAPANKRGGHDYVYSDVGFYLLKRVAERLLGQPINVFLETNFYQPLGLQTMCYRPLERFDKSQIAPTELDEMFRHELIQGTVHDPGAAMLGGIGGHAGLFSNALDLTILMQMNMQDGEYGGQRYLMPQTIPYFTTAHFRRNRRGLGWDKPLAGGGGPTSARCSPSTFGHTGFTGTCAWADPTKGIVFVFLSNRVCPDANNKRLITENIRPRMQDIIYRAIMDTNLVAVAPEIR